jgi:hypothetical protein
MQRPSVSISIASVVWSALFVLDFVALKSAQPDWSQLADSLGPLVILREVIHMRLVPRYAVKFTNLAY